MAGCEESPVNEIKIIMYIGCPTYFNVYSSQKNFPDFAKYCNHITIATNIVNVLKAISNETKYCYVITFPRWVISLCPNIQLGRKIEYFGTADGYLSGGQHISK